MVLMPFPRGSDSAKIEPELGADEPRHLEAAFKARSFGLQRPVLRKFFCGPE